MIARVDAIVNALDFPFLINQEADACGVPCLGIITSSVGHPEPAIRIAEQRKIEAVFFRKGGILLDCIKADAQNGDIVLDEVILLVTEPATLGRSARCIGLGIEPKEDLLAAQAA